MAQNPNDLLTAVIRREMTATGYRLALVVTRNPSVEAGALVDAMGAGLRRLRRLVREAADGVPLTVSFALEEGSLGAGPQDP